MLVASVPVRPRDGARRSCRAAHPPSTAGLADAGVVGARRACPSRSSASPARRAASASASAAIASSTAAAAAWRGCSSRRTTSRPQPASARSAGAARRSSTCEHLGAPPTSVAPRARAAPASSSRVEVVAGVEQVVRSLRRRLSARRVGIAPVAGRDDVIRVDVPAPCNADRGRAPRAPDAPRLPSVRGRSPPPAAYRPDRRAAGRAPRHGRTARPPRCRSGCASGHGRRAPRPACCSSTRPSTRSAAARRRATCRWARTAAARRASTSCGRRARRQAHLPRPGPARRLPDHARRRRRRVPAHDGARDRRRARRGRASRPRCATDEGRDYTGVWVRGPQDRLDRRAPRRAASRRTASRSTSTTTSRRSSWVVACGLPAVRMTSVAAGGSAPTTLDLLPQAHGATLRRRARPPPAARHARRGSRLPAARYPHWRERDAAAHPPDALPRQPRRDGRHEGAGRRTSSRSAAASRRGSRSRRPGGAKYRELTEHDPATRASTRSARRPPARTSASAGSAARPRS